MSKDCNNCKFTFRKLSIARFPYFKDTASGSFGMGIAIKGLVN